MEPSASRASRLVDIAQAIAFATSAGATDERLRWLTPYLAEVREALGMEVAFVSELVDERRVFQVVSSSRGPDPDLQAGHSDALLDTYCMYVVQGRLPPVIRDVRTSAHRAALLPITERLGIGCYVSASVVLPDGRAFGTLCCFSRSARPDLVESDGDALREVARVIGDALGRARAEHPHA
ncbi:GAF domain-containing protein [Ramlibacter henchirensis]|uniref:GAF domain-containing protein n=1 Tax=Ramlibacter henchirensis TaxID=204072 RepID=A0A4Z0BTS2_9BURK|nr:GAF domain-containing protein [Ramlibacter henchirensis]TFZ02717.1 GAF domain-containing protein [Ramlibacter henchirensis]